MKCTRAQYVLHLNREGEVTESLRSKALHHARHCPGCHAELALIEQTDGVFQELRTNLPVLHDPRALAASIMQQVSTESASGRARWYHVLARMFGSIRVQYTVRVAFALLVVAFIVQSTVDAHRMTALEARMKQQQPSGSSNDGSGMIATLETLSPQRLHSLVPREAGIASLAASLRIGPLGTTAEMDRFRSKYPALFSLSLENGIDARKRTILATEGRAFLQEWEMLIKRGETSYER